MVNFETHLVSVLRKFDKGKAFGNDCVQLLINWLGLFPTPPSIT